MCIVKAHECNHARICTGTPYTKDTPLRFETSSKFRTQEALEPEIQRPTRNSYKATNLLLQKT